MRVFWLVASAVIVLMVGFFGFKALNKADKTVNIASGTTESLAYFDELNSGIFKYSGKSEVEVDTLISLLPENVSLTYAKTVFDQDTGATTLNDITINMSKSAKAGVKIEQLMLWGVDQQAIVDRANGRRLQETIPIAKRVEAKNISVFGLETLFQTMIDSTNDMTLGIVENMVGDKDLDVDLSEATPDQSIDKFDFNIKQTIVTDVTVHPWMLELTEIGPFKGVEKGSKEDVQANGLWHLVQKFAAWNHALSYKDYASYDVEFDMEMTQDDHPFNMEMSYELMGYKDIYRGDTGFGVIKGSRTQSNISVPVHSADGDKQSIESMKSESFTEFYTVENIKISPVLNHMARGEFPGRDKVDLLSFGIFRSGPSWSKINDIELFSMESAYFDGSKIHWFIPEVLDFRAKNMRLNIGGFMDYMQTSIGMADEEMAMTDEQIQTFKESIKILEKYDLSEPVMDLTMALHWDAQTGVSDIGYSFDIRDFISYDVRTDAILPDYNKLMANIPEKAEDMDSKAFVEMFAQNSAFKKYNLIIGDKGGLDKGFAMAVDFAQLMPEDDPQTAMLRNTTPEILRNMATNAFILPMSEVGKVFPPGVKYLQSMSDFIGKGGTLAISVAPKEPLYAQDFPPLMQKFQENPNEVEEMLGIQIVHTPSQ